MIYLSVREATGEAWNGEFMDKKMRIASLLIMCLAAGIFCGKAFAKPDMALKEKAPCALCHVNPAGGKDLSDVGKAYKENKELPKDAPQVPADKQAKYTGDNECAACHTAEYGSSKKTRHAAAFKPLLEKKAENNAGCLACHTTGAGLPGGYADGLDALKNVTCEACHGPGSLHNSMPTKQVINTAPGEILCKSCHAKFSPKFEYTEWVKRGVHDLPGKMSQTDPEVKN